MNLYRLGMAGHAGRTAIYGGEIPGTPLQNLLHIDYEKILLMAPTKSRGDYLRIYPSSILLGKKCKTRIRKYE